MFREDAVATGVVSIDCWAAHRTGTPNFDFPIAFPPLKVTTLKLFRPKIAFRRHNGIQSLSKAAFEGFASCGTGPCLGLFTYRDPKGSYFDRLYALI